MISNKKVSLPPLASTCLRLPSFASPCICLCQFIESSSYSMTVRPSVQIYLDFSLKAPENYTNQTGASNLTSNGTWNTNYTKNGFDYNYDLELYDDELFPGEGSPNEANIMVK